MATQSYNQLKICEFGNHGNKQNCIKIVFDSHNEGSNKDVGFLKTIHYS